MTTCTLCLALQYLHWKTNRIIFALHLNYVNRIRSMLQHTCTRKPIQRSPKRSTQKSTLIPEQWTETAEATYPNPNPSITWLSAHQLVQVNKRISSTPLEYFQIRNIYFKAIIREHIESNPINSYRYSAFIVTCALETQ